MPNVPRPSGISRNCPRTRNSWPTRPRGWSRKPASSLARPGLRLRSTDSGGLEARGRGQVAEVIGLDVAAIDEEAYEDLRQTLQPRPTADTLRFVAADFSGGLARWEDGHFDGVVSGLSISYAEHYDEVAGRWTTAAYDHILAEVYRVVRPGGTFVFSVNVPDPKWGRVAWRSLASLFDSAGR